MRSSTTGKRVYPDEQGQLWLAPGDYGRAANGEWFARSPVEDHLTGSLRAHEVAEHEDGTITVSPSILITGDDGDCQVQWHGYLERGVWRTV